MNMKKDFLTWVLMKYGRNPIALARVRSDYARLIDFNASFINSDLGWQDYEQNNRQGLCRYFGNGDLRGATDNEVLNDKALEYINE